MAIEKIGTMHEQDEYNNLKRTLFFQKQAEEITKQHIGDDEKFVLPFPFQHRPCLGSRVLIREHFGRIIHTVLSEFNDWKDQCREMAILLVRNMIIYSEEYCTQNAELLLSSFHKYINDKNNVLAETAKECCSLIGKYVYSIVWIDYLHDIIYHEFDIEWIMVLQQLVLYCPMKRLSEIAKQIVVLMEYVLPLVDDETSKYIEFGQIVTSILTKVSNASKKYPDSNELKEIDDNESFKFSSEFCGFHLEIIDETETNKTMSTEKNTKTLQQRIDSMLNKY